MKKNKIKTIIISIIIVFVCVIVGYAVAYKVSAKVRRITNNIVNSKSGISVLCKAHERVDEEKIKDVDILTRYNMTSLERMDSSDEDTYVNNLQIIKKIENLGIDKNSMLYPEKNIDDINDKVDSVKSELDKERTVVDFNGETSEELQKVINENAGSRINVTSKVINMTSSVIIPDNTYIQGNSVLLVNNASQDMLNSTGTVIDYAFFAENKKNISITGVNINGGFRYGVYAINSSNIQLSECEFKNLYEKPLVVISNGNSEYIIAENNIFTQNGQGGIYVTGNVNYGRISNNKVFNNYGTSNWMAGIVLTDVLANNLQNIWEKFDANHHFPYKENIYSDLSCPHNIVVSENEVVDNNASGIYGDGAYMCYLTDNYIYNNDKEGVCLDYGSFGCFLSGNTVVENGSRSRQTDNDLAMDFVLEAGRMDDGSANSKIPGISLDNTAYNTIINNLVSDNYGGGIKMVRTTVRCVIAENILKDNNNGENEKFHFFGIELGNAEGDVDSKDIDFTPDYENVITKNIITGNHFSGIYVGRDCYTNDIYDNNIINPELYYIEMISDKKNTISDNKK